MGHIHFTGEVRGTVFGKLLPAVEDLRVDIDNLRDEIADLRSEVEALEAFPDAFLEQEAWGEGILKRRVGPEQEILSG